MATMTKSNFVPVYTNSNRLFIDSDYCCFRQHRTRLVVGLSNVWIMRNRRPKVSISFFLCVDGNDDKVEFCSGFYKF